MTDQPNEQILEKLRGAIALRDGASTPGEAAAAAAAVTRLLQKYNLTIADLSESRDTLGSVEYVYSEYTDHDSAAKSQWIHNLVSAIAEANFCKPLIVGKRRVGFVGRAFNAKASADLFNYLYKLLHQIMEKEISDFRQREGYSIFGYTQPAVWRKSWLSGATTHICHRLTETSDQQTSALMVVSTSEIDEFLSDTFGRMRKSHARRNSDYDHRAAGNGYSAAANIALQTPAGEIE